MGTFARSALIAVLCSVGAPAVAQTPLPPPRMSQAEGVQLFAAAGFRIGNGTALNICGQPAKPKITFYDLNGDGRPEAVAVDRNPACYGQAGDWFTVVAKDRTGQWRAIMRDTGVLAWEATRTRGWLDARRSGGGRCDRVAHFNGSAYIQSSDCVGAVAQAPSDGQPAATPPAASAPGANGLTAAERAAIFRAAGFKQKGRDWVNCENSTGAIEKDDVRDINGDGHLDAIVTESGTFCYGNTGQGFFLLTKASGSWKLLYQSPGVPEFLKTSANGWPDVKIGGPGFCFPIMRWNGKTYAFHRNHEEQKSACAQQRR